MQETYEEGYGTVLDSGTTFTYLPTKAFRAFREAVTSFAISKGLQMTKGPDPKFYDICFGGAPHVEHADQLENVFPHLDLQFKGVRTTELHRKKNGDLLLIYSSHVQSKSHCTPS